MEVQDYKLQMYNTIQTSKHFEYSVALGQKKNNISKNSCAISKSMSFF